MAELTRRAAGPEFSRGVARFSPGVRRREREARCTSYSMPDKDKWSQGAKGLTAASPERIGQRRPLNTPLVLAPTRTRIELSEACYSKRISVASGPAKLRLWSPVNAQTSRLQSSDASALSQTQGPPNHRVIFTTYRTHSLTLDDPKGSDTRLRRMCIRLVVPSAPPRCQG